MINEQAKDIIEKYLALDGDVDSEYIQAQKVAVEALKQEPILDKIRAEIADLDDADYDYEGYYKAVTDAVQIIDKHISGKE